MRLHRAQGGRQSAAGRNRSGSGGVRAREDRQRSGIQTGDHGGEAAEDALRQDPARHDQEDRRQGRLDDACNHRRSGNFGRDQGSAESEGAERIAGTDSNRETRDQAARSLSKNFSTWLRTFAATISSSSDTDLTVAAQLRAVAVASPTRSTSPDVSVVRLAAISTQRAIS